MKPLVKDPDNIRLAILGSSSGNGHPYSWSAIFNGYDRELMTRECPFAAIPQYLNKQPPETIGVAGVRVTHISSQGDGGFTAEHVARCSLIDHVVENPEDVIGKVDAVLLATDDGSDHARRAAPFIEAGVPLFIDKPLADNEKDLNTFIAWHRQGRAFISSSSMRYTKTFMPYRISTHDLGELRYLSITTPKSWERYGIHALEGIYPIIGPGFISVRNTGNSERNIVHLKHSCGADVVVAAIGDMFGAFGCLQIGGTAGHVQITSGDSYYAFKAQLEAFIAYLRTGREPFPFRETVELMRIVIAGIRSRAEGGREIEIEH